MAASPTALDRIVQRLGGAETIRDVIAFPKTASGFDLLTGAPAPVDDIQLRELGVALHERKTRRALRWASGTGFHAGGAAAPGPGQTPVHVDDPSFDSWEVVRDFGDLRTARAWHQALADAGIEAVLTADWPLDRFGRGDIALRVPADAGARRSCICPTSTGTIETAERFAPSGVRRWYG